VDHPAFRKAEMTTTLIDQWLEQGEPLLHRARCHRCGVACGCDGLGDAKRQQLACRQRGSL
jgi:hypothetical protein